MLGFITIWDMGLVSGIKGMAMIADVISFDKDFCCLNFPDHYKGRVTE